MEHEMIDWYDEKGKFMGVIDKAIAHKKGLWHKSIHVWIVNDNNEILLQKRCKDKKFFPNFWDCSFAGHVGAGENPIVSALREGEEELGLKLKPNELEYLFTIKEKFTWNDIQSNEFVDVYLLRQNIAVQDLHYQVEEVAEAKYFVADDILGGEKVYNIFPHNEEYELLRNVLQLQSIKTN